MYRDMTIHGNSDDTHDTDMMSQGRKKNLPCMLPELSSVYSQGLLADN